MNQRGLAMMIDKLSSRAVRFAIDAVITGAALYLAYLVRYDGAIPPQQQRQLLVLVGPIAVGRIVAQLAFGIHKHKWRYVNLGDSLRIVQAYTSFSALLLVLSLLLPRRPPLLLLHLPVSIIVMELMFSLFGIVAIRGLRRHSCFHWPSDKRGDGRRKILLVGAGVHGVAVANEMAHSKGVRAVGFVDDDPQKIGALIAGIPVLGPTSSLSQVTEEHKIDEILVCVPPASQEKLRLELPKNHRVRTRVIPTLNEILSAEAGLVTFTEPGAGSHGPWANARCSAIVDYPQTSIRNKTIVITGGAGFIGSALGKKLAAHNQVILLDTVFRQKPVEFIGLLGHPNVRAIEGNLLNGIDLGGLCRDADMVVHTAALLGVSRVCNAGRHTLETNYEGTSRLLRALEGNNKLQRLIYFSTSEVFGVNSFRVNENTPPSVGPIAESRWSYAIAKLASEHLAKAYFRETGMPITIVRPFNIFGPGRTGEHAMLRFILNALDGEPLLVHGDGSQIRSWCYIDDFCAALLLMLEKPEAVGEDFNIGNASNTLTVGELAHKVVDLCRSDTPITFVEHPFPDISIRVPSVAKAQSQLGYHPRYDLNSGMLLTIEWYRKHSACLESKAGQVGDSDRDSCGSSPLHRSNGGAMWTPQPAANYGSR
jgi:UDP-glucose 4-epimerase